MTSLELREKFLDFFKRRNHTIVPSSSLTPTDPSVLFTTAGMQQFKPYYLGETSPYGKNAVSSQKCFRTSDIEEVGDERHLTFFEMLGNFSFGGYEKEEAIKLAKDFLESVKLKIDYVTVFNGDNQVPRDEESAKIWGKLGFTEEAENLKFCGREDNFWGPTGEEGPCGPTTEIYSGGIEVWNIVFNQYYCNPDKSLKKLDIFGVDTGMGLERLAMVSQNASTVFETDLFLPIMNAIPGDNDRARRIIADHVKAAAFLISEGILPSNVERGYVLRRILRRAIRYGKLLNLPRSFLIPLTQKVLEIYQGIYPELKAKEGDILLAIRNEEEKFEKTLEDGLRQFEKGLDAFELYATYGFPLELTMELAGEKGIKIDKEEFDKKFKEHQEISRAGAEAKFGGHNIGLTGNEQEKTTMTRLHTATHLLHAALRKVLGEHVGQMGSDITMQRTRFDFSHSQKMTPEEIKKVEDLVNQKIEEGLEVKKEEMAYEDAIKSGALAFFKEKYPDKVSVYSIIELPFEEAKIKKGTESSSPRVFSREICAGPHVKNISEIGKFKIIKEESSGAGVRRIRAILE